MQNIYTEVLMSILYGVFKMKRKIIVIIFISLIIITGGVSVVFISIGQSPYKQVSKKIPSLENETKWFREEGCDNSFFCNAYDSERDPKVGMDIVENNLYFEGLFTDYCGVVSDYFVLNSTYNGTTLTVHFCHHNAESFTNCLCCFQIYGFIPNIPKNITTVIFDSYYDHEYSLVD